MSGIRLWRCSRCYEQVAVVIDRTKQFCGECFYRQTVVRVMSVAFATDSDQPLPPPPLTRTATDALRRDSW
jgi:hypothetical protein